MMSVRIVSGTSYAVYSIQNMIDGEFRRARKRAEDGAQMLIACITSFFENEMSWVKGMLHRLQCIIWFQWGLKLFPFIMIHADNQENKGEEELYGITFTHDEFWQQRFLGCVT